MTDMYKVGERVEFLYMYNDEDEWVPAIVTKAERKASPDTENNIVPHYDLESRDYEIQGALDDNLRIPALYEAGTTVTFYDKNVSDWVKAEVIEVEFQVISAEDQRQVPCYVITLNQQDRVKAQAGELRMPQLYKENDRVEFCGDHTDEDNWIGAIVKSDAKHVAISESNPHQIQQYDLQLHTNRKGGTLIKKGVFVDRIRSLPVTTADPDSHGETITATSEPATPSTTAEKNLDMETKSAKTEDVSENNLDSQPHPEIIETAPPEASPALEFDHETTKFFSIEALETTTELLPSPTKTELRVNNTQEVSQRTPFSREQDIFAAGDRVEVFNGSTFIPGYIVSATQYVADRHYSVQLQSDGAQKIVPNIAEDKIQRLFEVVGVRVHIHEPSNDPNKEGTWYWGIVLGKEHRRRDAKIAVGHTRYNVLTRHKGGLTVKRCETKNMRPFTRVFSEFDAVELQRTNNGVVSWELATVHETDPQGATYTVRVNREFSTVPGKQLRPLFMVGNSVRVLHHKITDKKFSGQSSWVQGVLMSVDAEAGAKEDGTCSYLYNVLLHDGRANGRDRMLELAVRAATARVS